MNKVSSSLINNLHEIFIQTFAHDRDETLIVSLNKLKEEISSPYEETLFNLIYVLFGRKVEKKIISIEDIIYNGNGLFSPIDATLHSASLFILGSYLTCENSIKVAAHFTHLLSTMFSFDGEPMYCFLAQEDNFDIGLFKSSAHLLFTAAKHIINLDFSVEIGELKYSRFMNQLLKCIYMVDEFKFEFCNEISTPNIGLYCDKFEQFNSLISLFGQNSGICSIKIGKNHIRSFAPHFSQIGDISNYGLSRKFINDLDETFWSRIVSPADQFLQSDVWVETKIDRDDDCVNLHLRVENFGEKNHLFSVFFIFCDSIKIDEKEFSFGELRRFNGSSRSVHCISGDDLFTIVFNGKSNMELIPLAGNDNFWGSKFLLAYDIGCCSNIYNWAIIPRRLC